MIKRVLRFLGFFNENTLVNTDLSSTKDNNSCGISFPEYDPAEYQRQKRLRNDKALNGCEFWDGINIDFEENLKLLQINKCPYCEFVLPERKGKSYKCPNCGGKIYRLKDLVSNFEGLFTQEQKEIREQLKKELSRRKNFLKIYQEASLKPPLYTDNKEDNIKKVINLLLEAKSHLESPKKINALRMCRFYGAKMQDLYSDKENALGAWLTVAYIDLWGDYNYLYDYKDDYKNTFDEKDEELFNKIKRDFEETGMRYHYSSFEEYKQEQIKNYNKSNELFNNYENSKIAPYVIKKIKEFNYDIEVLESLFLLQAKTIEKSIKYKLPITPEKAWERLYKQYQKEVK